MRELEKKLKSLGVLSFSLSGVIFIIFLIYFIVYFDIVFSRLDRKEISLENVQIIAVKATNSAKPRIAIYKEKRKILTAPCLDLCDSVGFTMKIDVERVTGIQQTNSTFFIHEISP